MTPPVNEWPEARWAPSLDQFKPKAAELVGAMDFSEIRPDWRRQHILDVFFMVTAGLASKARGIA